MRFLRKTKQEPEVITDEYVVWDKLEDRLHRGPMTQQECLDWMERCREIMPVALAVDQVFEVRHAES